MVMNFHSDVNVYQGYVSVYCLQYSMLLSLPVPLQQLQLSHHFLLLSRMINHVKSMFDQSSFVSIVICIITHILRVWYTCLQNWVILRPNVGKYRVFGYTLFPSGHQANGKSTVKISLVHFLKCHLGWNRREIITIFWGTYTWVNYEDLTPTSP